MMVVAAGAAAELGSVLLRLVTIVPVVLLLLRLHLTVLAVAAVGWLQVLVVVGMAVVVQEVVVDVALPVARRSASSVGWAAPRRRACCWAFLSLQRGAACACRH